jgi:hypothetical protein
MASSTTQEDGREKTINFCLGGGGGGDCPLQSLKGHYDLNLFSKSRRVDRTCKSPKIILEREKGAQEKKA